MAPTTATIPVVDGTPAPAPALATPVSAAPATNGAASAAQHIAAPPKDKYAPRKFNPSVTASSSGMPDLLRTVATQPMHTLQNLTSSTAIPTTIVFFQLLHIMDGLMVNTHKFTQSNPNWHPLVSQAYISFIIFIHIIRCMIEDNPTNFELVQFYQTVYQHIGLDSLVIPGPLVPLLAAITVSASPFEWIGNIAPTLPLTTGASARNGYRLSNRVYMVLPSLPFIFDRINNVVAELLTHATEPAGYSTTYARISNIFGQEPDLGRSAIYNVLTPNARFTTFVPFNIARNFALRAHTLGVPTFPTSGNGASTDEMNYYQFLGFAPYGNGSASNWLTTFGPIMSNYSRFFQGSVSLMSISPTGLGSFLPVATLKASSSIIIDLPAITPAVAAVAANAATGQAAVAAQNAHITVPHPTSLECDLAHNSPDLSELAEQYASLALVNCSFSSAFRPGSTIRGPSNATLRSGPYWQLPRVRAVNSLNTAPALAMNVSTFYHSATPLNK